MADTMKMDTDKFSKKYVKKIHGKLSLKENFINGEYICCFFDIIGCRCRIYESRPKQCRTFPFWEQFKKDPEGLILECPGVSLK